MFFFTGSFLWLTAMFVQVVGTLRYLQYRAEQIQERMERQLKTTLLNLFPAVHKAKAREKGPAAAPAASAAARAAAVLEPSKGQESQASFDVQVEVDEERSLDVQLEEIICEVAHLACRFILREAKSISPAWLWNTILERFLGSLLDLIGSDMKVIQLLEGFGEAEWPFVVQGMFPHLPLAVQVRVAGPDSDLPVEVDENGVVLRCEGDQIFLGDQILTVNGEDLQGRTIAEIVERYDSPTFTLEVGERRLEQAVLAISRASLTELRNLATYLRHRKHPANSVERSMVEKAQLQECLLDDPKSVKLLSRRIAASRTSGYFLERQRHSPLRKLAARVDEKVEGARLLAARASHAIELEGSRVSVCRRSRLSQSSLERHSTTRGSAGQSEPSATSVAQRRPREVAFVGSQRV